jgi:hypothetical protein
VPSEARAARAGREHPKRARRAFGPTGEVRRDEIPLECATMSASTLTRRMSREILSTKSCTESGLDPMPRVIRRSNRSRDDRCPRAGRECIGGTAETGIMIAASPAFDPTAMRWKRILLNAAARHRLFERQ